ncbi:hypothetical protein ZIOFF_051417 [Zingiber officinale]|uniref:Uncharacterized protein n=1 Tax=Zingiber officinale TaxID=94328 RepID=A0A8J5G2A9_ZINOF|nr:hypothetical protein ZIOFF_051417 [Zingiber officinale]
MRTVRLTRDRGRDAATMRRLLAVEGGLAVCPEGTTCREPYLLRFSPLFAEVAEEVVPVALDARVGMLILWNLTRMVIQRNLNLFPNLQECNIVHCPMLKNSILPSNRYLQINLCPNLEYVEC